VFGWVKQGGGVRNHDPSIVPCSPFIPFLEDFFRLLTGRMAGLSATLSSEEDEEPDDDIELVSDDDDLIGDGEVDGSDDCAGVFLPLVTPLALPSVGASGGVVEEGDEGGGAFPPSDDTTFFAMTAA